MPLTGSSTDWTQPRKESWLEETSIEYSKTEIPRDFKNGNYKTE